MKTKIYKTTILKPKSDTKLLNFRLNKEALLECRKLKQNSKYFNTEFFKSIFEWYTQKPKFQRERILFHEQLQVLEDAIKNQYEVLLENKNLDKVSCYKPVGIFSTKDENFNYLLTIGKKENSDKEMIYPTRLKKIPELTTFVKLLESLNIVNIRNNAAHNALTSKANCGKLRKILLEDRWLDRITELFNTMENNEALKFKKETYIEEYEGNEWYDGKIYSCYKTIDNYYILTKSKIKIGEYKIQGVMITINGIEYILVN